jgi:hypothetical protein
VNRFEMHKTVNKQVEKHKVTSLFDTDDTTISDKFSAACNIQSALISIFLAQPTQVNQKNIQTWR